MSEIFKSHEECENPRSSLIEGQPGMGKTTYCKKLVYGWAIGKQETGGFLPSFKIVLFIKCRDMKGDLWAAIDDQLLPRDMMRPKRRNSSTSFAAISLWFCWSLMDWMKFL